MRWPSIAALVFGVGIDGEFHRVELEAGIVGLGLVFHVVEDEEFGLGSEIDGVTDPHRFDHGLGALGDAARIARIGLAGRRLEYVAHQNQRRFREERIDRRRRRIRHQAHVGFVDGLPAGDRGAVEHLPFGERVFLDQAHVKGDMLPFAARIGEAEIDEFHVAVLDHFHDVLRRGHGMHTLSWCWNVLERWSTVGD